VQGTERSQELQALTRLAFEELARYVGGIGSIHRAIAGRVFAAVGSSGRLVEWSHDAISQAAYGAVRGSFRGVGLVGEVASGVRAGTGKPALSDTPGGAGLLGAINGLIGDALEREGSTLAQRMAVRVGGRVVPPDPSALAAAFPGATDRLVVFLHGLMETEHAWRFGPSRARETYGSRLARDFAFTPVYVRYNTGRHISENGRSLAELLEAVVAAWPVEVGQIALIGHSMGGLVARSACFQADAAGTAWVRRVRHVVSLGTPHMGAPLAKAVHYATAGLHAVPETQPFASFLRRRSAGIRDLRQGSLVDEDWRGCDPDALRAAACREVPLLDGATHCFVAATITRTDRHPMGRLLGDTLVLVPSASGRSRTRRIPFRAEDGAHIGGTHHLALLNHPAVYDRLHEWFSRGAEARSAEDRLPGASLL
jgi:pimeloyl-ACP methyl ester carboxylesterase